MKIMGTDKITIDGVTKTFNEWCYHYKLARTTVRQRIYAGSDVVDALTRPKLSPSEVSRNAKKRSPWGRKSDHFSGKTTLKNRRLG